MYALDGGNRSSISSSSNIHMKMEHKCIMYGFDDICARRIPVHVCGAVNARVYHFCVYTKCWQHASSMSDL